MWLSSEYLWQIGPKQCERFQSAQLLEFRASRPCIVPGCSKPSTVHHLIPGRTNISSDVLTSSECFEHHMEHEDIGDEAFQTKYGVDLLGTCLANLVDFLQQKGAVGILAQIPRSAVADNDGLYAFVVYIEEILAERNLADRIKVDHKRVSRGTAKSHGKSKGANIQPLTKHCEVRTR